MQMKTPLFKSYNKIFSPQNSPSADVFGHPQVPTVVCLIVNFSAQHCLKQLFSYGGTRMKIIHSDLPDPSAAAVAGHRLFGHHDDPCPLLDP